MNRMMLDVETMSTHESRALILSVGVVLFDLKLEGPVIHYEDHWVLNSNEQLVRGRQVSRETQKWWMQQSEAAKEPWVVMQQNRVTHVLEQIQQRYQMRWSRPPDAVPPTPCQEVWANGTLFDIGNMNELYADFGMSPPWKYNEVRDMRTLVRVNPQHQSPTSEMEREMSQRILHHPLADCRNQIDRLWMHWDFVNS